MDIAAPAVWLTSLITVPRQRGTKYRERGHSGWALLGGPPYHFGGVAFANFIYSLAYFYSIDSSIFEKLPIELLSAIKIEVFLVKDSALSSFFENLLTSLLTRHLCAVAI